MLEVLRCQLGRVVLRDGETSRGNGPGMEDS